MGPSDAVIPDATVIKNLDTNASRSVTSNKDGLYDFTNLQPGNYPVTATGAGFNPYIAKIIVNVGGHLTVEAKLTVTSTSVEVSTDQSIQVNTQAAEVSQVITQEQISQLPSLTRNPYDFVALSGNVSSGDDTASGAVQNGANRGVNFSLNGQSNSGTRFCLMALKTSLSSETNHHNLYIQETQLDAFNSISANDGSTPEVLASTSGTVAAGSPAAERRFLQFAGKINF